MPQRIFLIFILTLISILSATKSFAQPSWTIHLLDSTQKKPAKFQDYQLASEKLADKKFTRFRHFMQNSITHYNYYYNANNKVNKVVEMAKASQKDDYTKLLSFYPYSLDNTATQKKDLDSVIIKSTSGILLHDLRNDWVDNMYLLLGKAYFYQKNFDSALAVFQFINYNLFPRKKDEDDDRVVGTNDAAKNNVISIANPEKQNFLQKIASLPPSRNDALIWLVKTLIEQNDYGESAGLISTLQNDPNLPPRLHDDLEEVTSYWFFRQGIYDSAATHLEKALTNADSHEERARWEFLLGQLFEMTKQFDKASEYYNKASKLTVDPLMDIRAQLNNATMLKSSKPEELQKSLTNLLHMAKQDKFEAYRDILYFSAAELAIQKPDTTQAIELFNKSIFYNETNTVYKNKAYLRLGDIDYERKDYKKAFADNDSLQTGDTSLTPDMLKQIQTRRNALSKIVEKINIIEREDSLQRVAAMPPAEREAFVKKISKKLRKEQGDKDADYSSTSDIDPFAAKNKPVDLFSDNSKGEWYFYNASLKSKGFSEFKSAWGKRNNTDNWQRSAVAAAISQQTSSSSLLDNSPASMNPDEIDTTATAASGDQLTPTNTTPTSTTVDQPKDLSWVGLMSNLPLTPEKVAASNSLIAINLFQLGRLYQNEIEDYQQAINTYEESLQRFPDSLYNGQLYFGLYYCYNKLGNTEKANYYKNLTTSKFPASRSAKLITNPVAANTNANITVKDPVVTKHYEDIYNLFIEGNFDKALEEKKKADSLYGTNYWSPQMLYIESIYYIKQCDDDSSAKVVLKNLVKLYPTSPMKPKAERMIDVLNRRKSIEKYLTDLKVTRAPEDSILIVDNGMNPSQPVVQKTITDTVRRNAPVLDTTKKMPVVTKPAITDTVKKVMPTAPSPSAIVLGPYSFDSTTRHDVVMLLDKVDPTFVNEAKNAMSRYNGDSYANKDIVVTKEALTGDQSIIVFASFADANAAMQYYNKVRKAAPNEVSWLPAAKYSFFIITEDNLQILRTNKDAAGYKKLLNTIYPNRF